jgi:ClpP class serine protease
MATRRKPAQARNGNKSIDKPQKPDHISEINTKIEEAIKEFSKARDNAKVLPLFLRGTEIGTKTVDDIYDELREKFKGTSNHDRLDVILESSGGSIDPAYNIGLLLRRYAKKELNIIIPRWAKSAATVLACAGDKILMTPVAELGPVDPQITMFNALEGRLEEFSPLSIDATLDLIRQEFQEGNEKLAQGLLERLQFPLTLGSIKKSLEVGTHYIERLLSSRMLRDDADKAKEIANGLVHDYSNHGFCIEVDEACKLGLKVELLQMRK